MGLTWKAKVHSQFKGMTLAELNKRAGRKKVQGKKQDVHPLRTKIERHSTGDPSEKKAGGNEDATQLPEFSWFDQLEKAKQQGDCGSCYAIATLSMLETRLKVLHNINETLSIQHAVDCNYYNQGCDGGYSFLVGKFGHE